MDTRIDANCVLITKISFNLLHPSLNMAPPSQCSLLLLSWKPRNMTKLQHKMSSSTSNNFPANIVHASLSRNAVGLGVSKREWEHSIFSWLDSLYFFVVLIGFGACAPCDVLVLPNLLKANWLDREWLSIAKCKQAKKHWNGFQRKDYLDIDYGMINWDIAYGKMSR